jgi:hypothetical protein
MVHQEKFEQNQDIDYVYIQIYVFVNKKKDKSWGRQNKNHEECQTMLLRYLKSIILRLNMKLWNLIYLMQ